MKRLDELGISPAPWTTALNAEGEYALDVVATDYTEVAECINTKDARLIAVAPKLYEALREAITESCISYCGESPIHCPKNHGECFVQKWRAVLAEAAGESEVK